MNTERQFTEVGNSSSNNPRWEPQKTNLVPGAPFPFLEGYFKDFRELQGPNGPFHVATIVTLNPDGSLGQEVDCSGGAVLDDKLNEIPLGSFVRVQYEGKHPSKTPGRTYNLFKTFVDSNAIPFSQLGGQAKQPAPQQTSQQPVQQPFNPNAAFNGGQQQAQNPFQLQAQSANPFQQQQGPFGQPQQPTYQQSVQNQQFQQPVQQQPLAPVQKQTWVPPTQQPVQQPTYQQSVQNQQFQQPVQQQPATGGQVFGGSQMASNDDLPF